jgi:5-formyltetrahydrofolate cyclo-ligase
VRETGTYDTVAKAELRRRILALRDAITAEQRIEMGLAAAAHGNAHINIEPGAIVSGFFPIRSEIDIRPLMDALRVKGARLCVPTILDRQTIEFRELVRGGQLIDTGFGTVGPGGDAPVLVPDLMLMPLAAFDRRGHRIGYGAGHYDRAIDRIRQAGKAPRLFGIAFSVQEVAHVPDGPHDRCMDAIVTEKGYREFDGEAG